MSLWIIHVCLSDNMVHFIQEMSKISKILVEISLGPVTGLSLLLLFISLFDSDYTANQISAELKLS